MPRGETINSEAYIIRLRELKKRYKEVRIHKNPTKFLL
jgi:hypothetical protein